MRAQYRAALMAVALGVGLVGFWQGPGVKAQEVKPLASLLKEQGAAPNFTLKTPQGETVTLSELTKKSVVLLDFHFIRSDFCRMELIQLQRIHEVHGKGLTILAINVGRTENNKDIQDFWTANKLAFPVVKNGAGLSDVAKLYQVTNFPTDYLIGKDGKIISRWVGYPRASGAARLKKELARAGFEGGEH